MEIPPLDKPTELRADVIVVGGGTAGTMAALSAAEAGAQVLLLEKAHVRHSGALAMGMDGVNNAVIPGKATPADYVAEITRANDGIVNQRTVMQTAQRGFEMVQRLERYGVKFEKDEHGEYAVRQVHRSGRYVLPMPEGKDIKKVLYRVLRERRHRELIRIENRVVPVRVLVSDGRAVGVAGFNSRSGEFIVARASAVILSTGACGRLGLPASGYLYGTYENPTNAGDGYSMAFRAGAELSGIECFQVNPLIKDYNGPACAYVANPFGGYQVNNQGDRFVDCDYWSGQMMAEFAREVHSERGPVYLKLTHLADETIQKLEGILHTTERPTRGTFHANRHHDYRTHDVEMHISEVGLCSGHSASGVWVDENGATTVPGLYAAGDLACVPHNYMIGAFVFGALAGQHAASSPRHDLLLDEEQLVEAHELIYRPLRNPDGLPQQQVEYKLRRLVNDYVAPPKTSAKLDLAVEAFARMDDEIAAIGARTPHELLRAVEVSFIRDCAEMATRASIARTESRWGLYHERLDYPLRDDERWFCHLNLRRAPNGSIEFLTRPIAPYLVPVEGFEPRDSDDVVVLGTAGPEVGQTHAESAAPTTVIADAGAAARILELVRLGESGPDAVAVQPYLDDADPGVRRTAVTMLTELASADAAERLVVALDDPAREVRLAAIAALTELADVLPSDEPFAASVRARADSSDPQVRALAAHLLRVTGAGRADDYTRALSDEIPEVRIQGLQGAVRRGDLHALAPVVDDPVREVRIALADGLASLPDAGKLLSLLMDDPDVLVRAAALTATGDTEPDGTLTSKAIEALSAGTWQEREGAARALRQATTDAVIAPLLVALEDANIDVRKAAVQSLAAWANDPGVGRALRRAMRDPDADVRAFARSAADPSRVEVKV